ncbi:MAG: Rnf-Nqr domain containing protein, partial [Pseudomonadota bacterium]
MRRRPTPSGWTTTVFAMAPLCMLSDSALTGLVVAFIATSTLLVSLPLSKLVAARWSALRLPGTSLMVAATWVSVLDLLLHWMAPELRGALGPYAPLAVGSFALLVATGREHDPIAEPSRAALAVPLITGVLRELLGTGRLLG